MILFAQFYHHLSIKMQQKDIKSISYGNYKHQVGRFKRRTRGLQTPHAEMTNAARGDCNLRTRRFFCRLRHLPISLIALILPVVLINS